MAIIPLVLSGGSGTRLWPLSRATRPKQFLRFGGPHTLFQETLLRCRSDVFDPRPIIVGAEAHRFLLAQDLHDIAVAADILLEPVARNSCAAIVAGCLEALKRDPDAIVLTLAADHAIPDRAAFAEAAWRAERDAGQGFLVTFGITPDHAATGYGYIAPGKEQNGATFAVNAFVEKPDRATAERYVAQGYLWNSGNFLFAAATFLAEVEALAPDILSSVRDAMARATPDLDFLRLAPEPFAASPSVSVDYAILEKTRRAAVLPVSYAWSDVGSWDAVAKLKDPADGSNVVIGEATIIAGERNLVHSEGRLTALLGVSDTIVVATRDAILVASRERAEDVKALVARIETEGRWQARAALQVFRPWGNYECLDRGTSYQVKRLTVKPGGILSLQRHHHRAEHWVVVEGTAEVTIGDRLFELTPNQSAYIPAGTNHRLANRGDMPAVLIEVQTGSYLGEDDIVRLEDVYNRPATEAAADLLT